MDVHSIYDNNAETLDRYTVFTNEHEGPYREALCLSDNPAHPLGFSQFSYGTPGPHLGDKITFSDLPLNVQEHIRARLSLI